MPFIPNTQVQTSATSPIYRKTTTNQVVNTVTETDLLNGEIVVAAGVMGTNGVLRIMAHGTCKQNSGSVRTVPRLRLKHGGTTLFDLAPGGNMWANNVSTAGWWLEAFIQNTGTANAQNAGFKFLMDVISDTAGGGLFTSGQGTWHVNAASGGVALWSGIAGATGAKDTASSLALEFTTVLPVADLNVEFSLLGAVVEVL